MGKNWKSQTSEASQNIESMKS